ncbi:capsular polysaccharide biosynthesis protein [Rubritalea spongiae]|uniref:Capsular polysaccharide biosynthesis protein n=1 Tax=Rubritalea spongiae TaxID=430797 RepID=A0ABW5E3L0_9BACT
MSTHSHPLVKVYRNTSSIDFLGWGYKNSGLRAIKAAKQKNETATIFEDGFVRSIFPGYGRWALYSIVADTNGIYYDATGNSDLIRYLNGEVLSENHWSKPISVNEIDITLKKIREYGISKYNCHLDQGRKLPPGVLVVDQTAGDAALKYGGISASDFDRMLQDAIDESGDSPVYVKTHPDHQYRAKHSCFTPALLNHPKIKILPEDFCVAECFRCAEKVYVGTSNMGMEALIHRIPVVSYGWNYYAGWGLTDDRSAAPLPPRKHRLSIEKLFEAAYLRYTHYFDPDTKEPCNLLRIIEHIKLQHSIWKKRQPEYLAIGLSPWKKSVLPLYLGAKIEKLNFSSVRKVQQYLAEEKIQPELLVWGATQLPKYAKDLSVTRIEDGFIRSRGLGANFNFPLSWVFDDIGIYFDARTPSRLEYILENHDFTDAEVTNTNQLIDFLCRNKITKYNLGQSDVTLPIDSVGKKTILIPGQVDSDASIKYGSPKLRNNRELLAEVRKQYPEAYICYKPHPDLLAGARKDAPLWEGIESQVDHLVTEGDIISWIKAVDEVHTLTSTVGFEALLHKKTVHTYGIPFYAGWGLTVDWLDCPRRTRRLSIPQLACAALCLYPTYLNPKTGEFITALDAAKILANPDFQHDSRPPFLKLLGTIKSWFYKLSRP